MRRHRRASRSTSRPPPRGGRDALARAAPRARGAACVAGGDAAAVGSGNADDVATSLDNLIENALVHAPEGSTVTITWGREGSEAFVAVLDEGPGISARGRRGRVSALPARRGAARGRGGTGLGLAIVGALAARWGGSASLQRACRGRHARRDPAAGRARPNAAVTVALPAIPWPLDALSPDSCRPRPRGPARRRRGRACGERHREPVVHARRGRAALRRQPGAAAAPASTPRQGDDRSPPRSDAFEAEAGGQAEALDDGPRRRGRSRRQRQGLVRPRLLRQGRGLGQLGRATAARAATTEASSPHESLTDSWGGAYQPANHSADRLVMSTETRESS